MLRALVLIGALLAGPALAGSGIADLYMTTVPLTGAGLSSPGGSPYTPPTLNGGFLGLGDSYIGNGMGNTWSTGTFTSGIGGGLSYLGDLETAVNNRLLAPISAPYGVGAQSSLGVLDRMASLRRDLGTATSTSSTISGTILTVGGTVTATWDINELLTGAGVTGQNVTISGLGTGTGGTGTYTILNPNSISIGAGQTIGVTANPAFATTASGNDALWSISSSGQYSVESDPTGNVVFLNNANNDGADGLTPLQSMTNVVAELAALGPLGANKRVVMGNLHPRGIGISKNELHTIAASVAAAYVPNSGSGTFQSYNCNGNIDTPVVVANYQGGAISNGHNTVFTKAGTAASQPASQGTYNITAAGVYWFNATDVTVLAGQSVALYYCFNGLTSPSLPGYLDLHTWMGSSASNFVGNETGGTGTNYGIPGALYNRPWVSSADTWDAVLDPATGAGGTGTYLNIPGTSYEGLHDDTYGAWLDATAENTALASFFNSATPAFSYPAYNNYYINKANGVLATFAGTLPGVMAAQIVAIHTAFPSGGQFEICYLTTCAVDNGSGVLISNGVVNSGTSLGSQGASAGTINYTTGAYSVTFTGTVPPVNGKIIAYGDPIETALGVQIKAGNYLANGQLDWATTVAQGNGTITAGSGCATTGTGTSASNFAPGGWILTFDANTITAVGAGTLILACGYDSGSGSPDGQPAFWITAYGASSAAAGWTLAQTLANTTSFYASTDTSRSYVRVSLTAGPGGHLYGMETPSIKTQNSISSASAGPVFQKHCGSGANDCFQFAGKAGDSSILVGVSDLDLQQQSSKAYIRDFVTMAAATDNDIGGHPIASSTTTIIFNPIASSPVDAKIWFENTAQRILNK